MYRGELDVAQHLNKDLLRLSCERNDSAGIVLGHDCSGRDLLLAGKFALARSHLEQVLAIYDPIAHRPLVHHTGADSRVVSRGYLGIAYFCLGFPEQASLQENESIAEARILAHPPTLAASLAQSARLISFGVDYASLETRASELLALATQQGFPMYCALGTLFLGWVKANTGNVTEGISLLRGGSNTYRTLGAEARTPYHFGLLARGLAVAGQIDDAMTSLETALELAERIGERWFTAEMYRHKGQLMLRQGRSETAEELYRQALTPKNKRPDSGNCVSQLASAVSAVTRVATPSVEPIYGWFTEGFETRDLKEAKALLDELA